MHTLEADVLMGEKLCFLTMEKKETFLKKVLCVSEPYQAFYVTSVLCYL